MDEGRPTRGPIDLIWGPQPSLNRQVLAFVEWSQQFDTEIHLDRTRAFEPLERTSLWDAGALRRPIPPVSDNLCQRLGVGARTPGLPPC